MADKSIQLFGSKEYRFLNWLKRQEQTTSRGAIINFSQEEIAAEYGSSPATVNKWLQSLQSVGCVEQKKKGSYRVTKTGGAVIAQMDKIEKLIGGVEK
ncbi:MAG: winged helix-turn-helix domain-containing protein [Oscillospiraceae bacterium]|nr:winged helix-turn-helix domain-containing protein [Oscillospiraceae bacterium]